MEGYRDRFGHTMVGDVITQFDRVTGDDIIKEVRIRNKVKEMLSLKYF